MEKESKVTVAALAKELLEHLKLIQDLQVEIALLKRTLQSQGLKV
jgi:hypothetical protein